MKLKDVKKAIDENDELFNKYIEKYINVTKIENMQIERFYKKCQNKSDFIEKVIKKYKSKEYENRWYKRNIEPPQNLYWFLYEYASTYGIEANDDEYKEYAHMFTSNIYIIDEGYAFMRVDGQGSYIDVFKI